MKDLSVVFVEGRLARDVEVSESDKGRLVKGSLAWTHKVAKNSEGKWEDVPGFIDFEFWASSDSYEHKTQDYFINYGKKGTVAKLSGTLGFDSWEDKTSGQKRSKIKINVREYSIHPKSDKAKTETKQPAKKSNYYDAPPTGRSDEDIPF